MQRDLETEIGYLRRLAQAGERAPLLGGPLALWWGVLTSVVIMAHWLIIIRVLALPLQSLWILWLSYMLVGGGVSAMLGLRMERQPGAGSIGNRSASAVWTAVGISLFCFYIGLLLGVLTDQLEPQLFSIMLPVALLAYAIGWTTTATMAGVRLLYVPAGISLVGVPITVALVVSHWVYPATATVLFFSAVAPGLWLLRNSDQR